MSKRFIDTNLFSDEWFMDLSKDGKLLHVYLFTNCDHAGIVKLNPKLLKFQTDIKDLDKTIKELGNRCVRVSKDLNNVYFLPKFIKFQYPGFPNSKVKQQQSALKILESFNIDHNSYLSVSEDLGKSYEHDNDNDNVNEDENVNTITTNKVYQEFNKIKNKDLFTMDNNQAENLINYYFLDMLPIDSDPEFIKVWVEWVDYRKEIKKKLTKSTAEKQVKKLLQWDNRVDVINHSIQNGWTGLFETNSSTLSKSTYTDFEVIDYCKKNNIPVMTERGKIKGFGPEFTSVFEKKDGHWLRR